MFTYIFLLITVPLIVALGTGINHTVADYRRRRIYAQRLRQVLAQN